MKTIPVPIHVLDFEGNRDCGIVEYGVATLEGGVVTAAHTRICRARSEIRVEDVRIHGITFKDTQAREPFEDERALFFSLRKAGLLAAHSAGVERGLLKAVWPFPSYSPDFIRPGSEVADWGPWVDTCVLYQNLYPDLPEHKLGSLVEAFGLGDELAELAETHCPGGRRKAHCALYDALAAALLLLRLDREPAFAQMTLPWLLQHASPRAVADASAQEELF